jgi:hypothetical protein
MSKQLGWKGQKPSGKPRRNNGRRRGRQNKSPGKQALRLARQLQAKLGKSEIKYHDSAASMTEDYDGTLAGLNEVAQGDGNDERVGNQIILERLNLRYYGNANTGNALTRVIVIWDKMNKITTTGELLEDSGAAGVVISPFTYDNLKQYEILFDKVLSHTVNGNNLKNVEVTIDLKQKLTVFDLVGTNINVGYLKIATFSNLVTTNLPTLNWSCRLFFRDD